MAVSDAKQPAGHAYQTISHDKKATRRPGNKTYPLHRCVRLAVFSFCSSPTAVAVTLVVLTVLVFVPIKYVYPSRTGLLRGLNMTLASVWMVSVAVLLLQYPDPHPVAVALSLSYPVYYVGVSVWLTVAGARRTASADGVERAG